MARPSASYRRTVGGAAHWRNPAVCSSDTGGRANVAGSLEGTGTGRRLDLREAGIKRADEVVRILDAAADADEAVRDAHLQAILLEHIRVGHNGTRCNDGPREGRHHATNPTVPSKLRKLANLGPLGQLLLN
eukprot:gene147-biopygen85